MSDLQDQTASARETPTPILEYASPPQPRGFTWLRSALLPYLGMVAILYGLLGGLVATPSTGYGADSARQLPILVGVSAGTAYAFWRPALSGRRLRASMLYSFGASLILMAAGLQMRAFRLDAGFPQSRWRLELLDGVLLLSASAGVVVILLGALWERRWVRRHQRGNAESAAAGSERTGTP